CAVRGGAGVHISGARVSGARVPGRSADLEPGEPLGLLFAHVDAVDLGLTRPLRREVQQPLYVIRTALEHRLDRAVGAVARPAGNAVRVGALAQRIPEEHA